MIVAAVVLMIVWGYGVWWESSGPGHRASVQAAQGRRAACRAAGVEYDGRWRRGTEDLP